MSTPPDNSPSMARGAPTVTITGLAFTHSPRINGRVPKKTLMIVQVGQQTFKTSEVTAASQSPNWATTILVGSDITAIQLSWYSRNLLYKKKLLATTEVSIDKFVPAGKELFVNFVVESSNQTSTLVIHYESNTQQAASNLVALSRKPKEGFDPSGLSTAKDITDEVIKVTSKFYFLDSIKPFKELFDRLAKVHPFASAAWSLLTAGMKVLEVQYAKDQGIVDLCKAMVHTFETANEKDAVREWDILESIFDAMIKQTIECQIFISGYIRKSYIGRLIQLDISKKTEEFRQGFVDIEREFTGKLNRGVAVVTIATHEAVKDLQQDMILNKLNPHDQLPPRDPCMFGTRVEPIVHVISWVAKMNGEVMLLTGLPGTGKSTLMSSIADAARRMGSRSRLGAYVRFDTKVLNDPSNIISTIAYRLALFDKRIADAVCRAVVGTPDFRERPIKEQFKILLLDPLRAVNVLDEEGPIVVLVDALDECGSSPARLQLLKVLSNGFGATLPCMRLIVAGRAIPDVIITFNPQKKTHIHSYSLDSLAHTEHDIRLFFTGRFHELEDDAFNELCAQRNAVEDLAKRACGLFIWATVTCTFIEQLPSERLLKILGTFGPTQPEAALDSLYRTALGAALDNADKNDDIREYMKTILGAIVVMMYPPGLTPSVVDGLLFHGSLPKAQTILRKLACVIRIPENSTDAIGFIHKSFYDFLLDKNRSRDDWHIDIDRHNGAITECCLRALGTQFDDFESNPTASISSTAIAVHFYGCTAWIPHLCRFNPKDQRLNSLIQVFFQKHFLQWLSSMSKLGRSAQICFLLVDLLIHTNTGLCSDADRVLRYDAFQFAERFIEDIYKDPLSVFSTGLAFCAKNSVLRTFYPLPRGTPKVEGAGRNRLLTLTAVDSKRAFTAVFFPDGSKFVSGSSGGTVRIWDVRTGRMLSDVLLGVQKGQIFCVRVSPDGSKIASAGDANIVVIRDAVSCGLLATLHGHNKAIRSVAFSPDSTKIVSAGEDKTIRIWNAADGLPVLGPIHGHDKGIYCVVFSPDGTKLLSAAQDQSIRMWDACTGASLFEPILLDNRVMHVAFSPDGTRFASGCADKTVRIWDSATGKSAMDPIRGHDAGVTSVAFSNDGTRLASASEDMTIRICDAATGNLLAEPFQGHSSFICSVHWSQDDTKILSASMDSTVRIWDVSDVVPISEKGGVSSNILWQLWNVATSYLLGGSKPQQVMASVAFSPDGTKFISVDYEGMINVWEATTSSLIMGPIKLLDAPIGSVAFHPSGSTIVSGSGDGMIRLWDLNSGSHLNEPLEGHKGAIMTVSFSSDGCRIVSASRDRTIKLWDVATRKELFTIRGHEDAVNAAFFSPDGRTIASGSNDCTIGLWNASNGEPHDDFSGGHDAPVVCVAWSSTGTLLASASRDSTIKLWDFARGRVDIPEHFWTPRWGHICMAFEPMSERLLVASYNGMVGMLDSDSGKLPIVSIHRDHSADSTCLAISPDGSKILTGSVDKALRMWDASSGKTLSTPIEKHDLVTSFYQNDEFMALGAADNTIHVWHTLNMRKPYKLLVGHKNVVLSLSIDPNSTKLASGSKDMSFIVWVLSSGDLLYRVEVHTDIITSVVFSPDGSMIATAAADRTIRLWDASGGASLPQGPLKGHTDSVVSVAFSPDGLDLVSASLDGTLRVWDTSTGSSTFVTESIDESLQGVVFSSDGHSLIYVTDGGVLHKWPFGATSLASSTSSSDHAKKMPLTQSEILIRFPRASKIGTAYMTSNQFLAVIQGSYELIRFTLP